ncbi:MBL fold metallo-hydrolase [Microbacterium marinilacus]|uniref:MBL fold metallo-hydrolase n=1 Tax=Microbacterium marinilacus TaxID=415209 RepID=A0ABP7B5F1_9MICO|nr:MBL fold metallo-hydrolase [Microbacterium marinilacus]MBY0687896.1 MBL fold metallo-hydrolase [Microbacterium marinilacus]
MRITKHEHAALRVEAEGRTLLIDPGSFTSVLDDLHALEAVVITHEHADHWTPEQLDRIFAAAPSVPIFTTAAVASALHDRETVVVSPGDETTAGPFSLRFFGGRHEEIHSSLPAIDNVGVLVNDELYYPGDSYAIPEGVEVGTLAVPVGAPWLRLGDAMDFLLAVEPRRAFGTHDMTLSVVGRAGHLARLKWATEQGGGTFNALEPGDSIDV